MFLTKHFPYQKYPYFSKNNRMVIFKVKSLIINSNNDNI